MAELRTETMTVNMGPQHPSTHGVLRLVLEIDGEIIKGARTTVGYLHTGIEKTAEQKKWQQVIPLVERMDYLAAQSNSLGYAMSVEKLLGLEMPQRVKDIRVLIAELQRIASHLVWLGTHAMEIGAVSMLFYALRERELLMNINELIAGFRFFPSYIRIGGLREDLPRGFHETVKAFLERFPNKIDEYEGLLNENDMFRRRTEGVGVLTQEDTLAWGLVGPIARASGSDYDVRRYFPYLSYPDYDFKVATATEGDVFARYRVRMQEMRESLGICRHAIERITPTGQWAV
jgi:NADH-quinone oxidoreductase subunit D